MSSVPDDLAKRLYSASERHDSYRSSTQAIADVDDELLRARQLSARWRRDVGRTAERLEQLSGFRPLAFVRGLFGRNDQARAALAEKLAHAKSEHDEADRKIPELESRRRELLSNQAEQSDAVTVYSAVLQEKECWLRERVGADVQQRSFAAMLDESAVRLGALEAGVASLKRFVSYGRQAEGALLMAKQCLQQAKAAGSADVMGLGVMAGHGKHRAFDEGKVYLNSSERHLRDMSAEMRRHADHLQQIQLSTGLQLADRVFDGLGIDLFVQYKIVTALEDVGDTIDHVRQALWAAEKRRTETIALLGQASDERARWIEQAG
jgi:hypothetical protein